MAFGPKDKPRAISLISGGMDSTVLAYDLRQKGYEVYLLSVNYGQRHKKELEFAERTARALNAPWFCAELSSLTTVLQGSALTTAAVDVPEGHYSEDNMAITVVPNRNAILLSIATGWAVSVGAELVSFAAHAGDHAQYPDCRSEFIESMEASMKLANETFLPGDF